MSVLYGVSLSRLCPSHPEPRNRRTQGIDRLDLVVGAIQAGLVGSQMSYKVLVLGRLNPLLQSWRVNLSPGPSGGTPSSIAVTMAIPSYRGTLNKRPCRPCRRRRTMTGTCDPGRRLRRPATDRNGNNSDRSLLNRSDESYLQGRKLPFLHLALRCLSLGFGCPEVAYFAAAATAAGPA